MKRVAIIISLLICLFSIFIPIKADDNVNKIIIDPGHGGKDGGAEVRGVKESNLNLEISFKLKEIFEKNGYYVDLTRENEDDLCDNEFIKKEDMNKRVNKINNGSYLFCISIHQNTFINPVYRGAQIFYSNVNENNKILSSNIIKSIKSYLKNTTRDIVKRDNILLLNKVTIPCCIVECGFLTNYNEFELLTNSDYQISLAYAIYNGCIDYLKQKNINL